MTAPLDAKDFAGPIAVTTIYFFVWYFHFLRLQTSTKRKLSAKYAAEGKVFDRYFDHDRQMLAADRGVGNTLEQMVPFIVGLWLYSGFVSLEYGTWLGMAYVALRSLYPWLLGTTLEIERRRRILVATIPNYLIVFYMYGHVTVAALT